MNQVSLMKKICENENTNMNEVTQNRKPRSGFFSLDEPETWILSNLGCVTEDARFHPLLTGSGVKFSNPA